MQYFLERLILFEIVCMLLIFPERSGDLGGLCLMWRNKQWFWLEVVFHWYLLTTGARDHYIVPIRGAVCGIR